MLPGMQAARHTQLLTSGAVKSREVVYLDRWLRIPEALQQPKLYHITDFSLGRKKGQDCAAILTAGGVRV